MSVSYLISSYNKSEYLEAVLECVAVELKITDGEIFIIDDGSSDGSWDVIRRFGQRDPRIIVRRQENRGIFNVTNQLIVAGTQEWLRIIDCDDPPIAGSTKLLIEIAEKTNADYIFGQTLPYGPAPLSIERQCWQQIAPSSVENLADPLSYAIRDYNHVPATTLIRRKSIPVATRLNENFISCQDLALALPIFQKAQVVRIDAPVCHQLVGSTKRLSANEALTYFQTIKIIKEFGATKFDSRYKYMSARKLVSRALRWMRRKHMIIRFPFLYFKLLFLYAKLNARYPYHWESYLDSAAEVYVDFIPTSRRAY